MALSKNAWCFASYSDIGFNMGTADHAADLHTDDERNSALGTRDGP